MQKIIATTDADSNAEGWMATWNTGSINRDHVVQVFTDEGLANCIPAADPLLSLKDAVGMTLDALNMRQRGSPISVKNLDRSAVGCCAVREVRGVRANQYPVLFSAGLVKTGDQNKVILFEVNPVNAPEIANDVDHAELMLNVAFRHQESLMQPTHLTTALSKMLKGFRTVRIKEGVHFLPGQYTEQFDRVVTALEAHPTNEAEFTTLVWTLAPGTRSLKAVLSAVTREVQLWQATMDKELSQMATDGTKMRSDGLETRLKQCVEQREFLRMYESLVGALPVDLFEAITSTEAAIANYGMLAMSS